MLTALTLLAAAVLVSVAVALLVRTLPWLIVLTALAGGAWTARALVRRSRYW